MSLNLKLLYHIIHNKPRTLIPSWLFSIPDTHISFSISKIKVILSLKAQVKFVGHFWDFALFAFFRNLINMSDGEKSMRLDSSIHHLVNPRSNSFIQEFIWLKIGGFCQAKVHSMVSGNESENWFVMLMAPKVKEANLEMSENEKTKIRECTCHTIFKVWQQT